jgi:hypothetical protein
MIHQHGCECNSYGCQLRRKGITVAASATPSRGKRGKPAEHTNNSWEKGIAGEHRGHGTFMPYLNDKGKPMTIKQGSEQRHKIKDIRTSQRAGTFFKT